jgi:Zn finger protein HypA/HybF involved in hydrogenase expression
MPEGYRTSPLESGDCCSPEIEVLFSLDAALYPSAVVSGRLSVQVESTVATGYCMKCKAQREIKNAKQITMKNGRPATEGACPVCGTKIFKIGAGAK